jgi:23S rRNA pseudouridine1911/1915/1917 synthase
VPTVASKAVDNTPRVVTVPDGLAGERLDKVLAKVFPEFSRNRLQSWIEAERVLVDGEPAKIRKPVPLGAQIELVPDLLPEQLAFTPEPVPLDVVYEDDTLVVINKPAGMVVHPAAGNWSGTILNGLLHRYGEAASGLPRAGIVHRLDKETSGVVVIARTDAAHLKLVEEFRDREVEKTYIALLHGIVKGEIGRVELPVARDLNRRARMTARRREGREARTDWRVLLRLGGFTLIQAGLHTGRTHQIRVHFSALGWPVVGDTLYGAPRQERVATRLLPPLRRNFLHAARIAFCHPRTGKHAEFRASLPEDLVRYLRTLAEATKIESPFIDAALKDFL